MLSDFNCNFGFEVEEIFDLGYTKNLDVSTLTKNSYSDSGVNSQRLVSTAIEV